jgi:hypothetical protein
VQFRFVNSNSMNRETVIVLGAGATRGAMFVQEERPPCPPMDADFFQQLQFAGGEECVKRLTEFIMREHGTTYGISMEEFFSQAEYTGRFHQLIGIPGRPTTRYATALRDFYRAWPRVCAITIKDRTCGYHQNLVNNLASGDTIISFNYDCLIDKALKELGGNSWKPKRGYGYTITNGYREWEPIRHLGRTAEKGITLLKPHGSLNWSISQRNGNVILDLEEDPPYDIPTAEGRIIPPTWFKDDVQREPFLTVWKKARAAIKDCEALIVIGYSLPRTDLFSRALFKVETSARNKRPLRFLIVVNPDKQARADLINVVKGAVNEKTRCPASTAPEG